MHIEREKERFHATAKTSLISLRNGDRIRISKMHLQFVPQKIHTADFSTRNSIGNLYLFTDKLNCGLDQYRSYVRISGPNGEIQTAKYFYLRNCSAGVHRKLWRNNDLLQSPVPVQRRTVGIQKIRKIHENRKRTFLRRTLQCA